MFEGVISVWTHLHAYPSSVVHVKINAQTAVVDLRRAYIQTTSESVVDELVGTVSAFYHTHVILKVS